MTPPMEAGLTNHIWSLSELLVSWIPMSRQYCPICSTDHDPSVGCTDLVGEALHEAGIKRRRMGKQDLKTTIKKTDRIIVISVIVIFLLLFLKVLLDTLRSSPR